MIRLLVIESFAAGNCQTVSLACGAGAAAAALILIFAGNTQKIETLKFSVFAAAAAAGFFIGITFSTTIEPAWSGLPVSSVNTVEGLAVSDSRRISSGNFMIEIALSQTGNKSGARASAAGNALLFFNDDPAIYRGELLRINTGLSASPQYAGIMKDQHVGSYSLLQNERLFTGSPSPGGVTRLGWRNSADKLRSVAVSKIVQNCHGLGGGAGGLFIALFTGNRDGMTAEDAVTFRRAGCSHILALSGMHLGILSAILLLILKPLPGRKPAFVISCVIIFAYLYLTGFGVSLVRAAVMYFFCGAAVAFYRKFRGIDVLMLSFITVVLIEPSSFYSISFQLSFLAVGGILIISPLVHRMLRPYLPVALCAALSCSIGAQLLVTPLLMQIFGELYPVGLAAGIILAPMVTVFIWTGIIFLITGFGAVASVSGLLYTVIRFTAGKAAELPSVKAADAGTQVLLFCAAFSLLLILYSLYRRKIDGISG